MKRKMLLFLLSALPVILSQNVQAQTSSRLIAESDWVNNGVIFTPVDSSYFNYSNGRGGDLTHTLKYDNATTWNFIDSATGYENFTNYIQEFDSSNNISSITYQYWDGSEWVLSTKTLYTYNSLNQVATMILQTWGGTAFVPVSEDIYSYNAANKLYLDQYGTWDALTMVFDAVSQKTYIYDASNTYLVNETDESFTSGSPVYTNKYDYTYTSSGQMLNAITSTWNGSAWIGSNETTYSYDVSGDLVNKLYQTWDAPTGTFVNDSLNIYSYSGSTLPQTNTIQTWSDTGSGTFNNIMQYAYTYNANGQLTSATGTSWNVVGTFEHANGDPMANYYYAPYSPTTSVKNITNTGGDANIYPVPAQNMLHIDLTWAEAQTATITIYNAQGSIVRQWDAPSATQYNSAIPVDNLASGAYFIQINGAQGQIAKQLVIAH